jgi:uncharacterized protein YggU (UPF0235/DUF167 family)
VRVIARARKTECAGFRDDVLVIRVAAPPVEGAANDALRRLVAAAVGVARSAVSVERGETGRNKTLRVSGDPAMLLARARTLAGEIDAVPTAAATTPASANQPRSRKR